MSLVVPIAAACILLATAGVVFVAWKVLLPFLPHVLISRREIESEAMALSAKHGGNVLEFIRKQEVEAWNRGDYAGQNRWHLIERAVLRMRR